MAKGKVGHNGATVAYGKGMCSPKKKTPATVHGGDTSTYAGASGKKTGKHVKQYEDNSATYICSGLSKEDRKLVGKPCPVIKVKLAYAK